MRKLKRWASRAASRFVTDVDQAARLATWPVVGKLAARAAMGRFRGRDLTLVADALAARDPDDTTALEVSALAAHQQGFDVYADQLFQKAASRGRLSDTGRVAGIVAARRLDPKLALKRSEQALALSPRSSAIAAEHAINLWLTGATAEAAAFARQGRRGRKDMGNLDCLVDYLAHDAGAQPPSRRRLARTLEARRELAAGADDVLIGILDYKSPELAGASTDIGDYVRSYAALRLLLRRQRAGLCAGSSSLSQFIADLGSGTGQPEDGARLARPLRLVEIDRDAVSTEAAAHADRIVWLPVFGCPRPSLFEARRAPIYPENVRPIFLSLQLTTPAMLTEELAAYLKRYEPIGCQDWSTVYWLRSVGVEAFLAGCVTLTVEPLDDVEEDPRTLALEPPAQFSPPPSEVVLTLKMVAPRLATDSLAAGLAIARKHIARVQAARRVVTSRLDCYLLSRALGREVEFTPKQATDRSLDGAFPLGDHERTRLASRMVARLDAVLDAVADGVDEAGVYARWRAACAPAVAEAKAHFEADPPLVGSGAETTAESTSLARNRIDVALSFDANYLRFAATMVNSLLANTSDRVCFHVLTRGIEPPAIDALRERFPDHDFHHLQTDGQLEGLRIPILSHHSIATMDRLFLPSLLPDVDRLVYADVDTIVLGNIAELAAHSPGHRGVAGRPSVRISHTRQVNTLEAIARKQTPAEAFAVRRLGARELDMLAPRFNGGVIVMDLERLRQLDFTGVVMRLVERFGVNDEEAMNLFTKGDYNPVPRWWNSFPYQEDLAEAKLIHWVGRTKPWNERNTPARDKWWRYALDWPLSKPA
ncbi:MAG: glycosyltransferase [Geminicoccaceae bacterium]